MYTPSSHQPLTSSHPPTTSATMTASSVSAEYLAGLVGVLSFDGVPAGATESDLSIAVSHFGEAMRIALVPHHGVAYVQMRTAEQV
jgi:hypothetical protein